MQKRFVIYLLITALGLLSGCASISSGVTEAIMTYEVEDKRRCWITGRSFKGLEDLFPDPVNVDQSAAAEKLKIMTVHGIGQHEQGYSRRLMNGLIAELGFVFVDERVVDIALSHPDYAGDLGKLTVYRYLNTDKTREILFYELTWDSIVEEQKRIVEFDSE